MSELVSPGQLRAALLRWSLFLAPMLLLLGTLSGAMAGNGGGNPWFLGLEKPTIYPPPATFGIVWKILYLLMGVALATIVTARGAAGRNAALVLFAVQFVLNLAWSPMFFGMHLILPALILLVVIDLAVIATIRQFYKVRPMAAWLLLPYLAWALFATALNWQFLVANPDGSAAAEIAWHLNPSAQKAI